MITKEDLKQEIEQLDDSYLDLVFRLLQQFPHQKKSKPDLFANSQPISYPETETQDGLAFTDIEDASTFGKQLRTIAWQRNQQRFNDLFSKRQAEQLSPVEQQELIKLNEQIEQANVERITLIQELAKLRGVTLEVMMQNLGIKTPEYA